MCPAHFRAIAGVGIWLVAGLLAAVVLVNDPSDVLHGGPGGCASTGTGVCTLRDAITFVNATPSETLIRITLTAGNSTIAVGPGGLPDVTATVSISGDPNFAPITIDGSGAGSANGLRLAGANSSLSGVTIRRFGLWGLRADTDHVQVTNVTITENELGGVILSGNFNVLASVFNGIGGNRVLQNLGVGISISGSDNSVTDTTVSSNLGPGIFVSGNRNQIGYIFFLHGNGENAIDGNQGSGIEVAGGDANFVWNDWVGRTA